MKNAMSVAATMMLLITLSMTLTAQTTATWKGGKPGRTNDWNCAANWKESRVPDEFSQVFIPANARFFPVINNTVNAIDALLVEAGAVLTLEADARLVVLGETGRLEGIQLLGTILNRGILEVDNAVRLPAAIAQHIQGNGALILRQEATARK